MKATKIRMKPGCGTSSNLVEIAEIYIIGATEDGFYKKETIHEHLKKHPGSIQVDIRPYPDCIPAISVKGEKYVKSAPDSTTSDNLLNLPRVK